MSYTVNIVSPMMDTDGYLRCDVLSRRVFSHHINKILPFSNFHITLRNPHHQLRPDGVWGNTYCFSHRGSAVKTQEAPSLGQTLKTMQLSGSASRWGFRKIGNSAHDQPTSPQVTFAFWRYSVSPPPPRMVVKDCFGHPFPFPVLAQIQKHFQILKILKMIFKIFNWKWVVYLYKLDVWKLASDSDALQFFKVRQPKCLQKSHEEVAVQGVSLTCLKRNRWRKCALS